MGKQINKHKNIIISIAIIIALTFLFGFYHSKCSVSSDSTSTFPMSLDILDGNIWLKGWILGTNNFYFTEIVPYAIGHLLGISANTLLHYISGIAWAIALVCLLYFFDIFKESNKKKIIVFLILVFSFFVVMPFNSMYTLLNANSHNNLYALQLVWLLLLKQYLEKDKKFYLVLMTILAGILYFSESVALMTLFAPVGCVALFRVIFQKDKKWINVLISLVISFVIGRGIYLLFGLMGGMETRGMPMGIITSGFLSRAKLWMDQLSVLLGCYGISFSSLTPYTVLTLLIMFGLLGFLVFCFIRIKKLSWEMQICIAITIVNFLAAEFTSVAVVYRYIVPGWFFGYSALFLFVADRMAMPRKKAETNIMLTGLCALCAWSIVEKATEYITAPDIDLAQKNMADFIEETSLGTGYGDFWAASSTEYYGNYQFSVLPVKITDDSSSIMVYDELIRKDWYNSDDIHYIVTFKDYSSSAFIDEERMFDILGAPTTEYDFSPYMIYFWDEDISKFLNNIYYDETVSTEKRIVEEQRMLDEIDTVS